MRRLRRRSANAERPLVLRLIEDQHTARSVSAIGFTTRTVKATIGVGDDPAKMDIDSMTGRLYVGNLHDGPISVLEPVH